MRNSKFEIRTERSDINRPSFSQKKRFNSKDLAREARARAGFCLAILTRSIRLSAVSNFR
jgi:hypothetical protein